MPENDEFNAFWSLYPRKVGKHQAEKTWNKIAKSPETVQAIMQGLAAHLPGLKSRKPQYIPHPSTWLNSRIWQEQPEELESQILLDSSNDEWQETESRKVEF